MTRLTKLDRIAAYAAIVAGFVGAWAAGAWGGRS